MMAIKYTPGPWRLAKCGNGFYLGEIRGPQNTDYENDCIADWVSESNAHLIAAAPDLLEALKDCWGWIETSPEGEVATAKALAAIAKAEGRT